MKVDYFIIGTQKSGTSSLKYYLAEYPEIETHNQLECAFFLNQDEFKRGENFFFKKYFNSNNSNSETSKKLVKHSAAIYFRHELERVANSSITKDSHFIIVFRNPIDRFYSSYLMEVERSGYDKSINEAIDIAISQPKSIEHKSFYSYGLYYEQLKYLYTLFSSDKVHVVLFEELKQSPEEVIRKLSVELELDFGRFNKSMFHNVKNDYKVSKSKTVVKLVNQVKQSSFVASVRNSIPSSFKNKINNVIEKQLFKPTNVKPKLDSDQYERLKEIYKDSIQDFEYYTKLKTGWLI